MCHLYYGAQVSLSRQVNTWYSKGCDSILARGGFVVGGFLFSSIFHWFYSAQMTPSFINRKGNVMLILDTVKEVSPFQFVVNTWLLIIHLNISLALLCTGDSLPD